MPGKRPWRKELKKLQRKRRRRKAAMARDVQMGEEEAHKLQDPAYQYYLQQQARFEEEQQREAERLHALEEEAWLRSNLLAEREFRLKQQQLEAAEAAEVAKRRQQEEELAAKLADEQRRREAKERRKAAAAAEFEQMMKCMETYLNSTAGPAPPQLRRTVESRPGQSECVLYERTNCCRYESTCINNHRRPLLSHTIVIRHFFMHPLLEEQVHAEYGGADINLEYTERDLRVAYKEFFEDVVPELKGFGEIRNFRGVRNILRHMRGHVFVEYYNERSALKAFIKLQGRYYAGRKLNVEFSSITSWQSAVCGLITSKRKCFKGHKCLYLHLFHNPDNKYNTPLEINRTPITAIAMATPLLSWNMVTSTDVQQKSRNWRWSESPEVEIITANARKDFAEKKNYEEEWRSESNKSPKTEHRNHGSEDSRSNSSSKYSRNILQESDHHADSRSDGNDSQKSEKRDQREESKNYTNTSQRSNEKDRQKESNNKIDSQDAKNLNSEKTKSDSDSADGKSISKRKRKKSKHKREKSSKKHKRKRSPSVERLEKRRDRLEKEKDNSIENKDYERHKRRTHKKDIKESRRSSSQNKEDEREQGSGGKKQRGHSKSRT